MAKDVCGEDHACFVLIFEVHFFISEFREGFQISGPESGAGSIIYFAGQLDRLANEGE